jgi:hypothetical protein
VPLPDERHGRVAIPLLQFPKAIHRRAQIEAVQRCYAYLYAPDASEEVRAYRHSAGAEKRSPSSEQRCSRQGIRLKLKIFSERLTSLQAITLDGDDAVSDNSHVGICVHGIYHVSQLVLRPPVVSIEK